VVGSAVHATAFAQRGGGAVSRSARENRHRTVDKPYERLKRTVRQVVQGASSTFVNPICLLRETQGGMRE
jgi:hypothetical protein